MGYVKYREDDLEISLNRERIHKFDIDLSSKRSKNESQPIDCYYCNAIFNSIDSRNKHIKKHHNVIGPLLFVNGKFSSKKIYVNKIEGIYVDLCGFKSVQIFVNSTLIPYDEKKEWIDLEKYIISDEFNQIKINNVITEIFVYPKIRIKNNDIDKLISTWETEVISGKMVSKNYPDSLNEAEKHYLDGLYNYFIACLSKSEKQKRYEDAYSILSEFDILPPEANCVINVIAFRLNWVDKLRSICGKNNDFFTVLKFFLNEEESTDVKIKDNKVKKLYIEDSLEKILDAILAYQRKDYNKVEKYLETVSFGEDLNLNDKIYLLRARMAIKKSKYPEAKAFYENIKTPFFIQEKNLLLNKDL